MRKTFLVILISIGVVAIASGSGNILPLFAYFSGIRSSSIHNEQQKADTTLKIIYTCSMHSEIIQDKAGKCPKCGMNLTAKEIKKDIYTCPMHSEIIQNKAGKCPKCGMNLVLKQPAKKTESLKK